MVRFDTAAGLVDIDVEGIEVRAYTFYRCKALEIISKNWVETKKRLYLHRRSASLKCLIRSRLGVTRSFVGHRKRVHGRHQQRMYCPE
jgi:hypothetical protein